MLNNDLKIAINAALEAGEVIMKVYDAVIEVEYKDDKSPLTQADKAANDVINRHLKLTDIPIISEENKQIDYATRKQWDSCWIVDPVDGTKEFIKRNGEFTVNIALIKEGKPVLGVIYVPVSKTLYAADNENNEAFKVVLDKHNTSIETILSNKTQLKPKETSDFIEVVASRSHMNQETLDYIESVKTQGKHIEIVSKGSSLKFCLIADGKADIYPRFAPSMEWDTAAGQSICEAAGVKVISNETNNTLLYNKKNLLNPSFIASK